MRSPEAFQRCKHRLGQADTWNLEWCTWFDGERDIDRRALSAIERNRWQRAQQIWSEDDHPLSLHNLAVLNYALLLNDTTSLETWRTTFSRWSDLAATTNEHGYLVVAEELAKHLRTEAQAALSRNEPAIVRGCLVALEGGWATQQLHDFEQSLLGDDLRRLVMACAEVRQLLLSFLLDQDTLRRALLDMDEKVAPVAQFLSQAALPAGAVHYAAQREVALLYRSLSRGWREIKQVDSQIKCLELASHWAPLDLREEIVPELEHLQALQVPAPDPQYQRSTLNPPARVGSAGFLGILIIAGVVGLYWVTPRPSTLNIPRQAIQKRINSILEENSQLVKRIATLEKAKPNLKGQEREQCDQDLAQLRQRNHSLVKELEQLESARKKQL